MPGERRAGLRPASPTRRAKSSRSRPRSRTKKATWSTAASSPTCAGSPQHFPIYVTDGYSGPLPNGEHVGCNNCHVKHSDHYNGLAVDIVPLNGSAKCDASWQGITRLALWAEPQQNQPAPPFRWVGYDGDAGHGCGNHLHLSWEHAAAPEFQLAEWVEVFPVGASTASKQRQPRHKRTKTPPAPPTGPAGGISTIHSGGVSPRGD